MTCDQSKQIIYSAWYQAVKAMCQTHRDLLVSKRLLARQNIEFPAEVQQTLDDLWTQLQKFGVVAIGTQGEIVNRCLLRHRSYAKKGQKCEIVEIGYELPSGHPMSEHGHPFSTGGHIVIEAIALEINE